VVTPENAPQIDAWVTECSVETVRIGSSVYRISWFPPIQALSAVAPALGFLLLCGGVVLYRPRAREPRLSQTTLAATLIGLGAAAALVTFGFTSESPPAGVWDNPSFLWSLAILSIAGIVIALVMRTVDWIRSFEPLMSAPSPSIRPDRTRAKWTLAAAVVLTSVAMVGAFTSFLPGC
jgi:hypothetical protein